jgi:lysosomal acid lipase/cholesteryl ester hydrolase
VNNPIHPPGSLSHLFTLFIALSTSICHANDFVELCATFGYTAEEHVVPTKDGYLLGVHRLQWRKGEEDTRVNCGPDSVQKRVIYLHHGLLMNSEVWVCLTDAKRSLPFVLVERGFDVWVRYTIFACRGGSH